MHYQSPMENSVILQHMFQFCGAKELAKCRLVCKQWYQESLVSWRKELPVTFSTENDGRLYMAIDLHRQESQEELEKHYCDDPEAVELTRKPSRNIKLHSCFVRLAGASFVGFWSGPGSNVTTLHLFKCMFMKPDTDIMMIVNRACPNLQSLNLEKCTTRLVRTFGASRVFIRGQDGEPGHWGFGSGLPRSEIGQRTYQEPRFGIHLHLRTLKVYWSSNRRPVSWLKLFSCFQSLTHVTVKGEKDFVGFIDAIHAVRQHDQSALPFTRIAIGEVAELLSTVGVTRLVKKLRLPFTSLNFNVDRDMMENQQSRMRPFILFQSNSLKEMKMRADLTLATTNLSFLYPFPFGVKLQNLTCLEMDENLCESLAFLQYTPALERLVIHVRGWTKQLIQNTRRLNEQMVNVRMTTLLHFTVVSNLGVNEEDLASLFMWMPNLKTLHGLRVNDKQFGILCGHWKNLTSLKVYGNELTDTGITGMRRVVGNGKVASHPNITDLQDLEEFSFWTDEITDTSVLHGLLQLPSLQRIQCCSDHIGWRTETKQALENKGILLTLWK